MTSSEPTSAEERKPPEMPIHTVDTDDRILAMVLAPFPKTREAICDAMKAFVNAFGIEPKLMHVPRPMIKALREWSADAWGVGELYEKIQKSGQLPTQMLGMDVVYAAPFFCLYAPNPHFVPSIREQRMSERPSARERHEARQREKR